MLKHQSEIEFLSHAELSASSASRWIACPASVSESRGLPNTTSHAAEEGTAAHELAETCLRDGSNPCDHIGKTFNGFKVDEEMADAVGRYTDFCRALPQGRTHVEQRLDFSLWVPGGFGTADFVSIKEGEAWVVDLKFGRHLVNADCDQLKCYALGVINQFGFDAQVDTVHMIIVQPRIFRKDTHTMRVTELLKWGKKVLQPAAKAALGDNPEFNPSESACRFCRASETCKPLAQHALNKAGMSFDDLTLPSNKLTPDEVAELLPHLGLIKSWCEKVASKAQSLAAEGHVIEGYKLVRAKTNRRWADEKQALQLMQKLTNEPVYTAKTISPAQALKILGDENEELNQLITKPEGRPTLVPVSDRRAEIDALEGFQVIEK
jgi:hypothetical protein